MALRRCRECGLPLRLSRGYVWPGNGTIFAKRDPAMRMVIFEADYYAYVWSELENALGLSVADAMIRGQQAASWDYLEDNVLYGWRKQLVRLLPFTLVYGRIIDELALFGFGKMEIIDYRRGCTGAVRIKRPFDAISIAWGLKGFMEFVEGKGSELAWVKEGDSYIISMSLKKGSGRGEGIDEWAIRTLREAKEELSFAGNPLPPQGEKLGRCPSCGVPKEVAELEWREEDGAIYAGGGDRRFIFSSGHIFTGVVRELERKAGRSLDSLVLDITRKYHLRDLQGVPIHSRSNAYRSMSRYLAAGGYGEVIDLSEGEGYLDMTIANPFHPPRLVGRIAGIFEYVEGLDAEIKYESPEPRLLNIEARTT